MHYRPKQPKTLNVTARCSALSQTLKRVSCFRPESRIIRYTLLPQRQTTLSLIDCEAIWRWTCEQKLKNCGNQNPRTAFCLRRAHAFGRTSGVLA